MSDTEEKNCNTCRYDDVGTFFLSEGQPYPRCEECRGAIERFTNWEPKWPPPKTVYNPDKPVTITLPARLWQTMLLWLNYGRDWNRTRAYWWKHCCSDGRMGAENFKKYEETAAHAENLCKVIEAAMMEEKTNEPTET